MASASDSPVTFTALMVTLLPSSMCRASAALRVDSPLASFGVGSFPVTAERIRYVRKFKPSRFSLAAGTPALYALRNFFTSAFVDSPVLMLRAVVKALTVCFTVLPAMMYDTSPDTRRFPSNCVGQFVITGALSAGDTCATNSLDMLIHSLKSFANILQAHIV